MERKKNCHIRLSEQITTNLVALNSGNDFFHKPGGRKSEIQAFTGLCFLQGSRGLCSLPRAASGGCRRSRVGAESPQPPPPFSHAGPSFLRAVPLCVFYEDSWLDLGPAHMMEDDLIMSSLPSSHLQRPLYQMRSHSQVLGRRVQTYLFWVVGGGGGGTPINPPRMSFCNLFYNNQSIKTECLLEDH